MGVVIMAEGLMIQGCFVMKIARLAIFLETLRCIHEFHY
jgi:hypothetical protein